jgi:hypothetical protein
MFGGGKPWHVIHGDRLLGIFGCRERSVQPLLLDVWLSYGKGNAWLYVLVDVMSKVRKLCNASKVFILSSPPQSSLPPNCIVPLKLALHAGFKEHKDSWHNIRVHHGGGSPKLVSWLSGSKK